MELKKLFQVLVVGGAVIGTTGCDSTAKKPVEKAAAKKETPKDAGTAEAPKGGGGVEGW